jgi:gliding motility-associated protein GldE
LEISPDDPFPERYLLAQIFTSEALYFTFCGAMLVSLLVLSAVISGSEVAFFSLTKEDILKCRRSKSPRERSIAKLIEQPKRLLATILIVNNLVNVAFITLSTFVVWRIVGTQTTEGLILVTLTTVASAAIVFFGEVVPKVYANHNNLGFAKMAAGLLSVSSVIFRPVSVILLSISNVIESRIERKGYNLSVDELHQALELTTDDNTSDEEKGILKGIVNFGTLSVKQVMRSRMEITAFDVEMNFHELMDKINKSSYSRIPVYSETIDKIEGLLYIKDLLAHIEKQEDFQWQTLLRPGFFIPENKKVDALLRDFQEKRVHMAIVVDEYGGTSGLITLEDVIEEIVGEINDEFDNDGVAFNKLDEHTYIFEGRTSLNDFCKIVGEEVNIFDQVKGESESLGGLLLELHSKLPRVGEKIPFDQFVFTVVSVDNKRIKRVRVYINRSLLNPENLANN